MNIADLQQVIGATPDGQWGPKSRTALLAAFTNFSAKLASPSDMEACAAKLGCSVKQVSAVAKVESSGSGFDLAGRPKILFERHIFHRLTGGKWSVSGYSNATAGGYSDDSWAKLGDACVKDPDAAFSAASWGKFQVLGTWWSKLGYESPYALAHSTVTGEAAHYDLLARYVLTMGLAGAIRRLSADPDTCRDFAAGYNGPRYGDKGYHVKLAGAMR